MYRLGFAEYRITVIIMLRKLVQQKSLHDMLRRTWGLLVERHGRSSGVFHRKSTVMTVVTLRPFANVAQ